MLNKMDSLNLEEQDIIDETLYLKYKNSKSTNNIHLPKLEKQEYTQRPLYKKDVQGLSSKAIFKFMTTDKNHIDKDEYYDCPIDVDDWERNRALLLWYPEWKERLIEMSCISKKWNNLVNNWDTIEKLYNEDHEKYGNKAYEYGECCKYIRILTSSLL